MAFDVDYYNDRRHQLGLTLQQIADRTGIPRRTIDNVFCGITPNPRIGTIEKIDKVLQISDGFLPGEHLSGDERVLVGAYRKLPKSDRVILLSAMRSIFPRLEDDIDLDRVRRLIEGGADDNENSTGES